MKPVKIDIVEELAKGLDKQEESGRNPDGTYKPGFTGNPDGRPKFSIVSILRAKLAEVPEGKKKSVAEMLVDEILDKAIVDKDVGMMKDILDRIDGKPSQAVELSGTEGGPIDHSITVTFLKPE